MTTATKERKTQKSGTGAVLSVAALKAALAAVGPAVAGRGPKPVLQNVLVASGKLTATDLELRIETPLAGLPSQPVLLPHARLSQIMAALHPSDEVRLTISGTACTVKAGNGEWRLPVEDPAEFPVAEDRPATPICRLPADQFVTLVDAVRFAADTESSRYALGAVLVEFKDGTLNLVATDGRRLAVASADVDQACDDSTTLVPKRAIDVLVRLAGNAEAVQLEVSGSELVATVDSTLVFCRLTDGRFPKWRDVDPQRDAEPATVVVGSLLHACRMAAVCVSEQSKGVDFTFGDVLTLKAKSSENGESTATCDLVTPGRACSVKLDPVYVLQWLDCGSFDTAETISVSAVDKASAVVFAAGDCRNIVMPLDPGAE
jgi:DNA polymerase-3 subunit beta